MSPIRVYDYHLAPASPLIDAGVPVGLPYVGRAPDIGRWETPDDRPALLAAIATLNATVATLMEQALILNVQVSSLTAERDAARATATAQRATLDAIHGLSA